jgi:hypothetical protein
MGLPGRRVGVDGAMCNPPVIKLGRFVTCNVELSELGLRGAIPCR